jgi:hypothetical protein
VSFIDVDIKKFVSNEIVAVSMSCEKVPSFLNCLTVTESRSESVKPIKAGVIY